MECPCGSKILYSNCCAQLHDDLPISTTAEMLMRARYTAFVIGNINFLYNTFHPSTRRFQSKDAIKEWSSENTWQRLEIIQSTKNTVEFKAFYIDESANLDVHHEKSNFKEFQGKWYYVYGRLI